MDQAVVVAGFFLDDQVPLKALLQRLLPTSYSRAITSFSPVKSDEYRQHAGWFSSTRNISLARPPAALSAESAATAETPPAEDLLTRRLVSPQSSIPAFPRSDFSSLATQTIKNFCWRHILSPKPADTSAFMAWGVRSAQRPCRNRASSRLRDKPFMPPSYQTWWAEQEDKASGTALPCLHGFETFAKG